MNLRNAILASRKIALPFVLGLIAYSLLGSLVYWNFGKEQAHLLLNSWHTLWADVFFKYLTFIGNGIIPVVLFLVLLFVRYSWALAMGVSNLMMGAVVQALKRSVFAGDHRPAKVFSENMLPHIDGVHMLMNHSFPSGHSATAFCMFILLALILNKRWTGLLFLIIALLTAFSRVYLSQHFIEDTIAGAWIGAIIGYLGYLAIIVSADRKPASFLNKQLWP